jgi:hypothetical protein
MYSYDPEDEQTVTSVLNELLPAIQKAVTQATDQ